MYPIRDFNLPDSGVNSIAFDSYHKACTLAAKILD